MIRLANKECNKLKYSTVNIYKLFPFQKTFLRPIHREFRCGGKDSLGKPLKMWIFETRFLCACIALHCIVCLQIVPEARTL
jgi:hypothetical protein